MRDRLKHWLAAIGAAAVFGLLAASPFASMEVWNNPPIRSGAIGFPFALFQALWILPALSYLAAAPIVRGLRSGEGVRVRPVATALRIAFLASVSVLWLFLLHDQMPCFLGGVPGCD